MQSTFSIHFLSSILYGGIRRSWCRENLSRICICILNRHFPTWKVKSFLAHCASSISKSRASITTTTTTTRVDLASGLEISCLLCTLAYVFHSHDTTNCLLTLWAFGMYIRCFSGFGAYTVASFTNIWISRFLAVYSVQRK